MNLGLAHETSTCKEEHFCQIISKSMHANPSCSLVMTKCSPFLPLIPGCDLDLWDMNSVLAHDKLPCQEQLLQYYFNIHSPMQDLSK